MHSVDDVDKVRKRSDYSQKSKTPKIQEEMNQPDSTIESRNDCEGKERTIYNTDSSFIPRCVSCGYSGSTRKLP